MEQVTGERVNKPSAAMRRCLQKLRHGVDVRGTYHTRARYRAGASDLRRRVDEMTNRTALQLYNRINTDAYVNKPYSSMDAFVTDVAAICKRFPTFWQGSPKVTKCLRLEVLSLRLLHISLAILKVLVSLLPGIHCWM